jgi:hypothetical protein
MSLQGWLGVAGFGLSLINAWQTWRRRPAVSIHPTGLSSQGSAQIKIEIQNRSSRPITIIRSRCWPAEPHAFWPMDGPSRANGPGEINQIIPGDTTRQFFLTRTKTKTGPLRVTIYWQSNAAIAFSKFPLIIWLSPARQEQLLRAGASE